MEGSGLQPLRGTEMSQNKKGSHTQVQERVVMMMGPDHRVAVKLIGVNVDSTGPQNSMMHYAGLSHLTFHTPLGLLLGISRELILYLGAPTRF